MIVDLVVAVVEVVVGSNLVDDSHQKIAKDPSDSDNLHPSDRSKGAV